MRCCKNQKVNGRSNLNAIEKYGKQFGESMGIEGLKVGLKEDC
jgi:hypothetical protein